MKNFFNSRLQKSGCFEELLNFKNDKKECGKIVSVGDYQITAKEIVKLLTDIKLFKEYSQNALVQSIENRSVLQEANAIRKVYENLWNNKKH